VQLAVSAALDPRPQIGARLAGIVFLDGYRECGNFQIGAENSDGFLPNLRVDAGRAAKFPSTFAQARSAVERVGHIGCQLRAGILHQRK
jgi:hypothetical protein